MRISLDDGSWRRWFAWRPVIVSRVKGDPWRIHFDDPADLVWLEWVERRPTRSISEQHTPFTAWVYRTLTPSELPAAHLTEATNI
jgi:hypothetical protein